MKTAQILILAAGLMGAAGCTSTREQLGYAKPIAFKDLPPAVQATVRREVGDSPIKRITQETKYAHPTYRVEVAQAWLNPTLWVNPDGAVVKESNRLVAQRSTRINEAAGAQNPQYAPKTDTSTMPKSTDSNY